MRAQGSSEVAGDQGVDDNLLRLSSSGNMVSIQHLFVGLGFTAIPALGSFARQFQPNGFRFPSQIAGSAFATHKQSVREPPKNCFARL